MVKSKRSRIKHPLLIVLLVTGISFLGLLAIFVVSTGLFYFFDQTELPVTKQDGRLLVWPQEIAPFFDGWDSETGELTVTKTRYLDGSIELDLDFHHMPDDSSYHVNVYHETSVKEARRGYGLAWGSVVVGMNLGDSDFEIEEQPKMYSYGDVSKFAYVKNARGEITGNMFITRIRNDIFFVRLTGLYFADGESFGQLVESKFAALEKHRWK